MYKIVEWDDGNCVDNFLSQVNWENDSVETMSMSLLHVYFDYILLKYDAEVVYADGGQWVCHWTDAVVSAPLGYRSSAIRFNTMAGYVAFTMTYN